MIKKWNKAHRTNPNKRFLVDIKDYYLLFVTVATSTLEQKIPCFFFTQTIIESSWLVRSIWITERRITLGFLLALKHELQAQQLVVNLLMVYWTSFARNIWIFQQSRLYKNLDGGYFAITAVRVRTFNSRNM